MSNHNFCLFGTQYVFPLYINVPTLVGLICWWNENLGDLLGERSVWVWSNDPVGMAPQWPQVAHAGSVHAGTFG